MLDQRNSCHSFLLISTETKISKTIAVLLTAMVFLVSCTNDLNEVKKFEETERLPTEVVDDVNLIYSDSAIVKLRLRAPKILRFTGRPEFTEFPEGIRVWFFDEYGNPTSNLKAGYALKFEDDGITEMREDVEVVNPKGEVLNTELLIWDEEAELIYTEAFVKVSSDNEVLFGEGLEADQDLNNYQIKNITGRIDIEDEANDSIF